MVYAAAAYDCLKNADINADMKQNLKNSRKQSPKKSNQIGCLFWIALILLLIILVLVNHRKMNDIASSTGFFNLFSKSSSEENKTPPEIQRITENQADKKKSVSEKNTEIQIVEPESDVTRKAETAVEETRTEETVAIIAAAAAFKVRDSILYFIVINEDGSTMLKKTTRSIRYTDSPLTSTINSLITGVSSSDINSNFISLIPEKTKLNKIWVSDGTAYMDFNENFLFNSFGREGYMGQLMQIVYTATEFSTVKRVQILIDGQMKKFLGSEGIIIEKPLTRDFFNR